MWGNQGVRNIKLIKMLNIKGSLPRKLGQYSEEGKARKGQRGKDAKGGKEGL